MGSTQKLLLFLSLLCLLLCKEVELIEPRSVNLNDPKESLRLAISEKITAPMLGALSYQLEYVPEHAGECKVTTYRDHFVEVASRNLNPGYYSMVTSIITLKGPKMAVLIDSNLYIAAFSLDQNKIEDKVVNKTLRQVESATVKESPMLVADENETYIVAITIDNFYIVNVSDLKNGQLKFKKVNQSLGQSLVKAEIFNGVLFVATREAGVTAFKVNFVEGTVSQLYSIHEVNTLVEDFAIQKESKTLYLLDFHRGIEVYNISNASDKPAVYDFIDLSEKTAKNLKVEVENNVILVAFFHRSQNVVAEINYRVSEKKFSFMRYFKFKDLLVDMHLIDEHMIAVGDIFVAVFPVNIHPKLIQNEMNGNIALSPIRKVVRYDGSYFVGLTNENLILSEIKTHNFDELTCALKDNSKLSKLIYKANVTSCGANKREYYDYCTYTKEVEFEKMEVIAGEKTAKGLWVAILTLCGLIVLGVVCLHLIRKRKERTILFLEAEFEKKRSMVALPSQRLSQRVGVSPSITNPVSSIAPVPLTEEVLGSE